MFIAVGTSRRRSILTTLRDEATPMSERELAHRVARSDRKNSKANVSPEKVEATRIDLRHIQLPLLEDSGLIEWDRERETTTTTNHRAFEDPQFQRLLETKHDGIDEALAGLAHKRRRILLAILRAEGDRASISKTALAQKIYQRENDETGLSQAAIDSILVSLSHNHLPWLHDTDIIKYNAETGHVAYTKHQGLEELISLLQRPTNWFAEKLDTFIGGLLTTYTQTSKHTRDPFGWPVSWGDPYYG